MPARKDVQMGHDGVGSPKSRKSRRNNKGLSKAQVDKAQEVLSGADDVFSKLEEERIEAEEKDAAESAPRLANFKDLVFLGKMNKTVEISGFVFSMHTLTGAEQRELLSQIMLLPAEKRLIYAKPYTLWMSLDTINDAPVAVAAQSAGYEDEFEFITSWQDSLIERLFDEYEALFDESKGIFKVDKLEDDLKK